MQLPDKNGWAEPKLRSLDGGLLLPQVRCCASIRQATDARRRDRDGGLNNAKQSCLSERASAGLPSSCRRDVHGMGHWKTGLLGMLECGASARAAGSLLVKVLAWI